MKDFLEEYGFLMIATVCASILIAGVTNGFVEGGFMWKIVVGLAEKVIGG